MAEFKSVKRVDDNRIEITKDIQIIDAKFVYDLNFLLSQQISIQADLDNYTALREAELKEVADLIAECQNLGIKPIEPEAEVKHIRPEIRGDSNGNPL